VERESSAGFPASTTYPDDSHLTTSLHAFWTTKINSSPCPPGSYQPSWILFLSALFLQLSSHTSVPSPSWPAQASSLLETFVVTLPSVRNTVPRICTTCFFWSFSTQHKCHFLRKVFPDYCSYSGLLTLSHCPVLLSLSTWLTHLLILLVSL
jgi:hypothetical protein